jgi:hypothetical protein
MIRDEQIYPSTECMNTYSLHWQADCHTSVFFFSVRSSNWVRKWNNNKKKWTHEPTKTHTHTHLTYLLTRLGALKLISCWIIFWWNQFAAAAAELWVGTMTRVIIIGGGGGGERECCMCRVPSSSSSSDGRMKSSEGGRSCCCCCCRAIDKQKKPPFLTDTFWQERK